MELYSEFIKSGKRMIIARFGNYFLFDFFIQTNKNYWIKFNIMIMYITKDMKHNHYIIMFFIMILSGLLTTMNIWVDKFEDIRFSLNDAYMISLMTSWMFLFMGIIYRELRIFIIGLIMVVTSIFCIRTQFFITESQYKIGMIPHHSMALFMSKKLLEKQNNIQPFLEHIVKTQSNEIVFLKTPTET